MLNNISKFDYCYGCGVCAIACNKNLIQIRLDGEGFYKPFIEDIKRCNNCGLCLSVCGFSDDQTTEFERTKPRGYAGWSNNSEVRHNCTSGGIGFSVGEYLIENGYRACGVRYNNEQSYAEHFVAETIEEFKPSIGSKYIQSYTLNAFLKFNNDDKYFVIGTPCQIGSLRRYLIHKRIEERYILMDFFCHGVPSMHLWAKYITYVQKSVGNTLNVTWRNKSSDWHDSYEIRVKGTNGYYISKSNEGDLFYKFFFGKYCLGRTCYSDCKYLGLNSAADLRVGDFWGGKYLNDREGVSCIISFTKRGEDIIHSLRNSTFIEEALDTVVSGQKKNRHKEPLIRRLVIRSLKGNNSLKIINLKYSIINATISFPRRGLKKLMHLLKM